MQLTMDDINVEWLAQKSPINHPFKGGKYKIPILCYDLNLD
jgi:hypothetical protein